jgi:diacylglycerol kinase family enzyme
MRTALAAVGIDADIELVSGGECAVRCRAIAERGDELLVVGGGDGTISAAASALVGTDTRLGILPLGTLNHFARDLGIPVELPEAIRVIADGEPRALDVGEVNGEIFINNSMLGLYPPMVGVRDRERRLRNRGKWMATILALFKVLPRHPLLHLRVTAAGETSEHLTRFVFIGNNEYEMSAFTYGARSRFDSGNLYFYIAKSRTRLGLVGLGLLSLFRDLKWSDRFERLCLPELTIETRKKAVPVYLDGEVVVLRPPLHYRNQAHALRVILPGKNQPK